MPVYQYVQHMPEVPKKSEEVVRSPRTRVTGGCRKHCVGAGIEPGSSA